MKIVVPSLDEQRSAAYRLVAVEQRLRGQEQEGPTTWWRVTDLRGQQWRFALASANPSLMQEGEPLSNYCEIVRGRQSRPREDQPMNPSTDMLPLATGMYLAGRRDEAAPVLPNSLIAEPGDVLVAVIGERPLAQVVSQPDARQRHRLPRPAERADACPRDRELPSTAQSVLHGGVS